MTILSDDQYLHQVLTHAPRIGKGQNDVVVTGEVRTPEQQATVDAGGNAKLQVCTRERGIARGSDAWCIRTNYAFIKAVAVVYPLCSDLKHV